MRHSLASAARSNGSSSGIAATLVVVLSVTLICARAPAQESTKEGPPRLGLGYGPSSGLELPGRPGRVPPDWGRHPEYRPYQTAYPYYIAPWGWYIPQTYKYKYYPPPVALEPHLGLMYNYPYAWQMGLQLPYDSEPLYTYSLGPYQGVVRSPQRPHWLHAATGTGAVSLMREGKYKEAGRLLAEQYRKSDDPSHPLLLAEALFALGKHRHAELLLRHALSLDGSLDALPDDVASHFPSADDYERRVQNLVANSQSTGQNKLLAGYLSLFTKDGSGGLNILAELMKEDPKDEVLGQLYRHFLGKAFGKPEEAEEKPGNST